MARQIYRKSVLERMASPDQLDKMIVITSPSFWLALLGGAVIVGAALVWSIWGRLPIKMEASGIFVSDQTAYTLASDTAGIVSSVDVAVGDTVEEGTVLFTLTNDAAQKELDTLLDRREKVQAVTLTSTNDPVTADSRDLINLKMQIDTAGLESDQNRAMLSLYEAELTALLPEVAKAEKKMETARKRYYRHIEATADSGKELAFNEAQSVYSQQMTVLSPALSSAEAAFGAAKTAYEATVQAAKTAALTQAEAASDVDALKAQINAIAAAAAPEELAFLQDTVIGPLLDSAAYADLQSGYAAYLDAEAQYKAAQAAVSEAKKAYEAAKKAYTDYADERVETESEKERLAALYNQYSNEYNALYSRQTNLESNIVSIKGQLQAAGVGAAAKGESYQDQFESTRAAILSSLDAEIEKYRFNLEKANIRANVPGQVTDIKVGVGAAVGQGSEVVTIRQVREEDSVVCYIPISSGKKVRPGMEAIVTPTTVNRQEYGHMKATVVAVDDYVTPASSIRATLGDDMLTQAFTQNGPVIGVTCRLYTDETTASGYWWSNRKGGELLVAEGTLVTVDVVTEEKAPITMLIPYLKDKFAMAVKPAIGGEVEGQ